MKRDTANQIKEILMLQYFEAQKSEGLQLQIDIGYQETQDETKLERINVKTFRGRVCAHVKLLSFMKREYLDLKDATTCFEAISAHANSQLARGETFEVFKRNLGPWLTSLKTHIREIQDELEVASVTSSPDIDLVLTIPRRRVFKVGAEPIQIECLSKKDIIPALADGGVCENRSIFISPGKNHIVCNMPKGTLTLGSVSVLALCVLSVVFGTITYFFLMKLFRTGKRLETYRSMRNSSIAVGLICSKRDYSTVNRISDFLAPSIFKPGWEISLRIAVGDSIYQNLDIKGAPNVVARSLVLTLLKDKNDDGRNGLKRWIESVSEDRNADETEKTEIIELVVNYELNKRKSDSAPNYRL